MKDLLKDFLEASRDRIKTPITGSFALAFILWNWRPILILLFSDSSIEDKIKHIDKNYCDLGALLIPLAIAVVYVIAVPYIMAGLEWTTKNAIERRKTHKANLTISDLDNDIKIAGKQFELEQVRSGQRDISELNDKIASLNTQIDNINAQHKTQVENYEKLIEGYKENEEENKTRSEELIKQVLLAEEQLEMQRNSIDPEEIAELLTDEEIKNFIDFCDFHFYKKRKSGIVLMLEARKRFEKLGLISLHDNKYRLTAMGETFYEFVSK